MGQIRQSRGWEGKHASDIIVLDAMLAEKSEKCTLDMHASHA